MEIFEAFDDLVLLSEGCVLYHGPVTKFEEYFNDLGYTRPSYMDAADFAAEVVSFPYRAATLGLEDRREQLGDSISGEANSLPKLLTVHELADHWRQSASLKSLLSGSGSAAGYTATVGAALDGAVSEGSGASVVAGSLPVQIFHDIELESSQPPVDTAMCANDQSEVPRHAARLAPPGSNHRQPPTTVMQSSTALTQLEGSPRQPPVDLDVNAHCKGYAPAPHGVTLTHEWERQQYSMSSVPSVMAQTRMLASRQFKLNFRNKGFIIARWLNVVIIAIVLGTLTLNAGLDQFQLRFGLALYCCIFM